MKGVSMLDTKSKQKLIAKFATRPGDTGSTQVQVAILTEEITRLTKHLLEHKKDHSSRRGLLKKISERRKLLRYFSSEDPKGYDELVKRLKLKRREYNEKKMTDEEEALMDIEKEAPHEE